MSAIVKIDSQDIWWNAQQMAEWFNCSAEHFRQRIACLPDFPRPSTFGKTKVWCLAEVSEYLRNKRDLKPAKGGRPRKIA